VFALIASAVLIFTQTAPQAGVIRQLDSAIAREAQAGFSGVVLVARGDTLLLHKAYAAPGSRSRPDVLAFWLASNSKQFTAAAILRLQEMKRLRVRDSIGHFFPNVPADKQAITIHQLLTHTSGLPHAYAADGVQSRSEAVGRILALALRSPPGQRYSYSNDGYTLLAAIVDLASGVGFDTFLERSIFRPAGLHHTGLWGREKSRIAPVADPRLTAAIPPTVYRNGKSVGNWGYRGASGAYATAADIHRWIQSLRSGRVLAPATVDTLLGHHFLVDADSTGQSFAAYGWRTEVMRGSDFSYSHTGNEDWLGHNSVVRFDPAGHIAIVLSSSGSIDRTAWASRINRLIRRYYDPF
jgi:CubicO group peptidase (beta-lactamase class C family)